MTVTIIREPGCRAILDVLVSPEASEAAYRKAIKVVNKEVSLPGFRKGKAPEHIVLQKYAKYIDQEWNDILVKTTFNDALALAQIYPFNERSVDRPQLKKSSREEGSHIIFTMEVMPEIPEVDLKNITLTRPARKEITGEDVDNAVMDLRLDRAAWDEIADRPIQEGDYVNVDIDNLDDPENPICKNTNLEVKKGTMGKWMYDLLIGKRAGDIVEGTSKKDDDLSDSDSFVQTHCRIIVNKIVQPKLPDLNDEFATKFGLQTVAELRTKVEEDLNKRSDEQVRENLRRQLEDFLFANYPFDVPSTLFEGEKRSRLQHLAQLKKRLPAEEYEKVAKNYRDEKINADVLHTLCLFFLKRKVAEDNKVEVTQDEILQETLWHLYNPNSRFVDPSMDADQIRSKIYLHLLNRKTNDFLVDQAKLLD